MRAIDAAVCLPEEVINAANTGASKRLPTISVVFQVLDFAYMHSRPVHEFVNYVLS